MSSREQGNVDERVKDGRFRIPCETRVNIMLRASVTYEEQ
jgi:hypothetical protein